MVHVTSADNVPLGAKDGMGVGTGATIGDLIYTYVVVVTAWAITCDGTLSHMAWVLLPLHVSLHQ